MMDNTSEKVCRSRTLVGPSGLPGANHSGLDINDLINEIDVSQFHLHLIISHKQLNEDLFNKITKNDSVDI